MIKRILGVAILSVALAACASRPAPEPEPEPSRGGFGEEGGAPMMTPRAPVTPAPAPMPVRFDVIYFEFDDASLRPDARASLRGSAEVLKQRPNVRVEIQGNCDNRGSNEYNLALGNRRAESAKRYLMDLGVNGSRITTVSFGEENPAVQGNTEEAWARNRRDEFVVR